MVKKSNIPSDILKYSEQFKHIELFEGLEDTDLAFLLSAAQIKNMKAHERLLSQGEAPSHLIVLLSGQAKIYRLHANGREAVIDILAPYHLMFASAIMAEELSPVSGEVIKESEVMMIPAAVVREQALLNQRFAANITRVLACQVNQMMFQFEVVSLRSAKERVGTFFLSSMLEQRASGGDFELAFEKNTIAHHLGMSPETLSRALKDLKQDGIYVQGSQVTLSNSCSLCKFYDAILAQKCEKAGTLSCPHYHKE